MFKNGSWLLEDDSVEVRLVLVVTRPQNTDVVDIPQPNWGRKV